MTESPSRGGVLHLVPHAINRGGPLYARELSRRLNSAEVLENRLVTLFASSEDFEPDVALNVPPGLGRRVGYQLSAGRALRRLVRSTRPDLVVAHGGEALKYAASIRLGCPLIYYRIGLSSKELGRPVSRALYRILCRRATLAVGISQELVAQLRDTLGVPPARIRLIPNSRDPAVYRPAAEGKVTPPLVMFIGELERDKRPGLFVETIARLRKQPTDFDAWLVGGGHLQAHDAALAARARIAVTGRRSDVADLLGRASLLVMTSDQGSEGMPGVLIEAGLSEVAVVSTPASGVADVVADGVTGLVVDSADPGELAFAVKTLLDDDERRLAMGRAARQRCEKVFSVAADTERWRAVISEARRG